VVLVPTWRGNRMDQQARPLQGEKPVAAQVNQNN